MIYVYDIIILTLLHEVFNITAWNVCYCIECVLLYEILFTINFHFTILFKVNHFYTPFQATYKEYVACIVSLSFIFTYKVHEVHCISNNLSYLAYLYTSIPTITYTILYSPVSGPLTPTQADYLSGRLSCAEWKWKMEWNGIPPHNMLGKKVKINPPPNLT